jgi:hypothetical protein
MADHPSKDKFHVDRRGTTFLVPLGISVVLIALVVGWVSMSGRVDLGSIMSRPNAPSVQR